MDDPADNPLPEEKPKIQVGRRLFKPNSSLPTPPNRMTHVSTLTSALQNVIPQQLLDQYLSMTDPARAQTVDTEIAKHCAFSLPGVALTLGRQNWHCLKDTYETLATDVQVRQAADRESQWRSE